MKVKVIAALVMACSAAQASDDDWRLHLCVESRGLLIEAGGIRSRIENGLLTSARLFARNIEYPLNDVKGQVYMLEIMNDMVEYHEDRVKRHCK